MRGVCKTLFVFVVSVWGAVFLGCGSSGGAFKVVRHTWQIQLNGPLDTSYGVEWYVVDLFDTPVTTIQSMKKSGKTVICYFSAGSYEDWRPDAKRFPKAVLGKELEGYRNERWLDIRSFKVAEIMTERMDLAIRKGCDGVDMDNVDGYTHDTGFPLTADDQLSYNRFLARQAHKRGLLAGLKNDLSQISRLHEDFDFAVNEQCHEYHECENLLPFVRDGKPVFNIEYDKAFVENDGARRKMCADSNRWGLSTLVLSKGLDNRFRLACERK